MHPSGSINPWSPEAERHAAPIWEDDEHTTPFSALADLLQNWPGAPQTSERNKRERHNRLMQVVAGYPEISSGRRPLDDPLHVKSVLAFKLSLFLDKIPTNTPHEWHSLRSELLSRDMLNLNKISDVKCLHTLMSRIRSSSSYKKKDQNESSHDDADKPQHYDSDELHPDEIRFLTVLHSQDPERRDYWPISSDGSSLEFKEFENSKAIPFFQLDGDVQGKRYKEHEFKFTQIQTWIMNWARPKNDFHPIHPDASHNLIIGASVMLESTFAKLRSQVIGEHGVGSIVVDGGGRLSYLSKRTAEDEEKWFFEKLGEILTLDNEHLHPYQDLIRETVHEYVKSAEAFIKRQVEHHNSNQSENKKEIIFEELVKNEGEKTVPKQGMYDFLYRPKYILDCLPNVANKLEEDSNPSPEATTQSWEVQHCLMCQPNEQVKECCDQAEITTKRIKSGVHEYRCKNCDEEFGNCFDTPSKAMKFNEENYVCPFHDIIYRIGKRATIRIGSRTDLFKTQPQPPKSGKQIYRMVMFDGNSIGDWFTLNFEEYREPRIQDVEEKEHNESNKNHFFWEKNQQKIQLLWNKKKNDVLDLNINIKDIGFDCNQFDIPEEWDIVPESIENKIYNFIKKLFLTRRMQVMIRRQRRSFHFNAIWWQTLTKALEHVSPWVIAGDDIVLVSSMAPEKEQVCETLNSFHADLTKNFPNTAISFAGALSTRNHSIRDLYQSTRSLEHEAGLFWKHLVSGHSKLPSFNENKQQKVKEWEDKQASEISRQREALKQNIWKFTFGQLSDSSVPSLLLHDNWKEMLD